MTSKVFPLSVVISVCHNRLVCSFDDYREFLDFMTGVNVPLWDVERARVATANRLRTLFSDLSKAPEPPEKTDSGNAGKYVRECVKAVGFSCVTVAPGRVKFAEQTLSGALK